MRLGGGDGDCLDADKAEHHRDERADHGRGTIGCEAAMLSEQVTEAAYFPLRHPASQHRSPQADERDNRHHLEHGEPEFELAVLGNTEQVGRCQGNDR
ncbi:hypothetical protein D3C78_1514920 [compost metagenome]